MSTKTIESLKAVITAIGELELANTRTENDLETLRKMLNEKDATINSHVYNTTNLHFTLSELRGEITEKTQAIKMQDEAINNLIHDNRVKRKEDHEKLAKLENKAKEYEDANACLVVTVNAQHSAIHDQRTTIKDQHTNICNQAATIATLHSAIHDQRTKIFDLNASTCNGNFHTAAKQDKEAVDHLYQQIKDRNTKIDELQEKNKLMHAMLKARSEKLHDRHNTIEELKIKVSKLETDIALQDTNMLSMSNKLQLRADEVAVLTGKRNSDALKIKELSAECNSLNGLKNKEQQEARSHREKPEELEKERVSCILQCTKTYMTNGGTIFLIKNLREVTGLNLASCLTAAKHMKAGGKFITFAKTHLIDPDIITVD